MDMVIRVLATTDTVPLTGRAMHIMADLMARRIGTTAIGIAVTGKRVSFSKDNWLAKKARRSLRAFFAGAGNPVHIMARPARVKAHVLIARRRVRFPTWS